MKIIAKQIIYGCEARGDKNSEYMTRYAFPRIGPVRMCLHVFHRSDAEDLHDHPWPFVSILLWRGYVEQTALGRRRFYPGAILFRKANHAHRVELIDGKKAVTLVFMGKRIRTWGFFAAQGWTEWTKYFRTKGC